MQLIGQKGNLEIINSWEDLPKFLIIQGESATGKNYMVNYLCDKFGLKYVSVNNAVASVRGIASQEYIKNKTLYHFSDFDTASIQAKNALLKIAEEPIDNMYIVITGKCQIKTLESRAKRLVMMPYTLEDILEYVTVLDLDKAIFSDELCKKLYIAGLDTPSKFKCYYKYDKIKDLVKFAEDVVRQITCIDIDELVFIIGSFENKYDDIDVCKLFLIFIIHIIENKINVDGYYSYYEIVKIIIPYLELLNKEPTLNRRMLLYQIFYAILNKSISQITR